MFFKKSHSATEIETSVFENLPTPQTEDGIQVALQSLANSAEIFEAMNLVEEAEVITQFIETIASGQFAMVKEAKKKSKKKTKSKSKSKKNKTTTRTLKNKTNPPLIEIVQEKIDENLTPERELENLENIGWVFNAPKSDCGECNMADDDAPISGVREIGEEDRPMEYEKCSECGFDHVYEPEKSMDAHFPKIDEQKAEIVPPELDTEYLLNSIDV